MTRKSFYMTLPSNASMNVYPENTMARFTTVLPKEIILNTNEWEATLTEIMYPGSFQNISSAADVWFRIFAAGNKQTLCAVAPGIYEKVETLIQGLQKVSKYQNFTYNKDVNRVIISYENANITYIHVSRKLAVLSGILNNPDPRITVMQLDFKKNEIEVRNRDTPTPKYCIYSLEAQYPPKLFYCIPKHLYVYSDIVECTFLGDTLSQFLRIVKVEQNSKDSTVVSTVFHQPYYVPLVKKVFNSIEINIRDELGNLVPFSLEGRVILVLHFRQCE